MSLSSLFERKARPPLGSVMPQVGLEDQLAHLHREMRELADMEEFARLSGWQKLRKLLLAQVWATEREIVSLARNPVDNQVKLIELAAHRDTLASVVLMQDQLPGRADKIRGEIEKRLNILRGTRDLPRAADLAPADESVVP